MKKAATLLAALALSPFYFFSQQPSASTSSDLIRALEIQVSKAPNSPANLTILAKFGAALVPLDLAKSRQVAVEIQRIAFLNKHGEGLTEAFLPKIRIAQLEERRTEAIDFFENTAVLLRHELFQRLFKFEV